MELGFDLWQRQRTFLLASVPRPALRPTQPPIHWVLGGKAWLGDDADHSLPSSAEVKSEKEQNLLSPLALA
jgi:hypothetical protein